jgi:hypothetical protein
MKMAFLVAAFALSAVPARASNEADVFTCAGIKADAERLACFDALAKLMLARQTNAPENYILQRFKKTEGK